MDYTLCNEILDQTGCTSSSSQEVVSETSFTHPISSLRLSSPMEDTVGFNVQSQPDSIDNQYILEAQALRKENATLKRRLKFLSIGDHSSDSLISHAIINVTYQNISSQAREDIESYLSKLLSRSSTLKVQTPRCKIPKNRESSSNFAYYMGFSGAVQYYPDFMLDLSFCPVNEKNGQYVKTWSAPLYTRQIEDPLPHLPKAKKAYSPNTGACFNCGSSVHSLSSCSLPRNKDKVRRAIRLFQIQKDAETADEIRYFETRKEKEHPFTPGKLSEKVKEALGMRENDLPPYYAKMELYGYPPGYYVEEKVQFEWNDTVVLEEDMVDNSTIHHSPNDVNIKTHILDGVDIVNAGDCINMSLDDGTDISNVDNVVNSSPSTMTSKNSHIRCLRPDNGYTITDVSQEKITMNHVDNTDKLDISIDTTVPRKRLYYYPGLNAPDIPSVRVSDALGVFTLLESYYKFFVFKMMLQNQKARSRDIRHSMNYHTPNSHRRHRYQKHYDSKKLSDKSSSKLSPGGGKSNNHPPVSSRHNRHHDNNRKENGVGH